jgi:hypothetical protein
MQTASLIVLIFFLRYITCAIHRLHKVKENKMANFITTIKEFEKILMTAQKERPARQGFVEIPKHWGDGTVTVPEWNAYELEIMVKTINETRKQRNVVREITLKDVCGAEQLAMGHSDYTHKFALYCAELAMGK